MAKRLQEHLNSQYLELAQKLRPRNSVRKIVAYVESYDDIFFWRTVLGDFETDRIKFEVMLPSRHTLCKGKKAALMNKLGPSLGDYMIACVDADYDYLVQGATEISRTLISSPFILHTYAYAIENYQCYAPALHTACVMSTLNDRDILSLEAFMEEYSKIIWPLFVWSIWAHKNGQASSYSITAFGKTIKRDQNELYFASYGETISAYKLSSGEKQMLIILLTVLVQNRKPFVLFMDEPEVSLHIEWQQRLLDLTTDLNPNVQVILTTHSPAVIMNGWSDRVTDVEDIEVNS